MKNKYFALFFITLAIFVAGFFALKSTLFAVTENLTITSLVSTYQTVTESTILPVFKIQFNAIEAGEDLKRINNLTCETNNWKKRKWKKGKESGKK